MLKEKLADYYGEPDKARENFIDKKFLGYTEVDAEKLYEYILERCPKNFGFPDISKLAEAFKAVPPSTSQKKYVCCVCNKCGAYYHYSMMYCPDCWERGEKITSHSVKVSDEEIPRVTRYNMEHVGENILPSCYSCQSENKNRCKHFGLPYWNCKEMRNCNCVTCCAKVRREAERVEAAKQEAVKKIIKEAV